MSTFTYVRSYYREQVENKRAMFYTKDGPKLPKELPRFAFLDVSDDNMN